MMNMKRCTFKTEDRYFPSSKEPLKGIEGAMKYIRAFSTLNNLHKCSYVFRKPIVTTQEIVIKE